MPTSIRHLFLVVLTLFIAAGAARAEEDSRHLAPGFQARPAASRVLVIPADIELFSISAGGIEEPKADWTEKARKNFSAALLARPELAAGTLDIDEARLDDFADIVALHRAVAESIWIHHVKHGIELPTKEGRLDWSLGAAAVKPLRDRTGADYALFTWVRDTYASDERKLAILAMALLGAINTGGEQAAYASLVDLRDGRVVWFNDVDRMWGDLRDDKSAGETVEALMKGFPGVR
ncbi:MAG TPA: hypothetical protein VHA82_05305 [Ramlibacter sp.]|uniref:hypothetical protein n=1 Tax=Ramlibacter sp. TaxID=1917967 RepID=UPI002CC8FD95|nr:hypothetical protein [Ramlibacter sp.]HVZ43207.1 hypothetical protein [Ramlibacter sp.]